jgi:hypothetical protein
MAKEIKTANLYSIDDGKKTEFDGEPTFENSIKHFEELLDRELRMTEQKDWDWSDYEIERRKAAVKQLRRWSQANKAKLSMRKAIDLALTQKNVEEIHETLQRAVPAKVGHVPEVMRSAVAALMFRCFTSLSWKEIKEKCCPEPNLHGNPHSSRNMTSCGDRLGKMVEALEQELNDAGFGFAMSKRQQPKSLKKNQESARGKVFSAHE